MGGEGGRQVRVLTVPDPGLILVADQLLSGAGGPIPRPIELSDDWLDDRARAVAEKGGELLAGLFARYADSDSSRPPAELQVLLGAEPDTSFELRVLSWRAWHEVLVGLLRAVAPAVLPLRTVEVRAQALDPTRGLAALGDLPELFDTSECTVVVNGSAVPVGSRRSLDLLAAAYAVPVSRYQDGEVLRAQSPLVFEPATVKSAMAMALTLPNAPEEARKVRRAGFEALIAPHPSDPGRFAPTPALQELFMADRFLGMPDQHSACADLLEQLTDGTEYGAQLRTHIAHWVRQRIWAVNYAPEMVLHDEAHSVSVDRNVAGLCERLVLGTKPALTARDLYVLAVSAWLHDWGHASAQVAGRFPTDPIEVRDYHGMLTAVKLYEEKARHGLPDDIVDEVALLCAHHQGWTSCSDDGSPALPTPRRQAVLPPNGNRLGLDRGLRKSNPVTTFKKNWEVSVGATDPRSYDRMRKLLALLRVADAADVGRHRVPNFDTQFTAREQFVPAHLRVAQVLAKSLDSELIHGIKEAYLELFKEARQLRTEADLDQLIRSKIALVPAELTDDVKPSGEGTLRNLALDAWDYVQYLVKQVAYYNLHHDILGVFPSLTPTSVDTEGNVQRWKLALYVIPSESAPDPHAAGSAIADSVMRELGRVRDETGWVTAVGHKDGIAVALGQLGIEYDDPAEHVTPLPIPLAAGAVEGGGEEIRVAPAPWAQYPRSGQAVRIPLGGEPVTVAMHGIADPPAAATAARTGRSSTVSLDGTRVVRLADGVLAVHTVTAGPSLAQVAKYPVPELAPGARLLAAQVVRVWDLNVVATDEEGTWMVKVDRHAATPKVRVTAVSDSPAGAALLCNGRPHLVGREGTVHDDAALQFTGGLDRIRAIDAALWPEKVIVVGSLDEKGTTVTVTAQAHGAVIGTQRMSLLRPAVAVVVPRVVGGGRPGYVLAVGDETQVVHLQEGFAR
jgi:hypothetical protein